MRWRTSTAPSASVMIYGTGIDFQSIPRTLKLQMAASCELDFQLFCAVIPTMRRLTAPANTVTKMETVFLDPSRIPQHILKDLWGPLCARWFVEPATRTASCTLRLPISLTWGRRGNHQQEEHQAHFACQSNCRWISEIICRACRNCSQVRRRQLQREWTRRQEQMSTSNPHVHSTKRERKESNALHTIFLASFTSFRDGVVQCGDFHIVSTISIVHE